MFKVPPPTEHRLIVELFGRLDTTPDISHNLVPDTVTIKLLG
jgi:hypothetical protein